MSFRPFPPPIPFGDDDETDEVGMAFEGMGSTLAFLAALMFSILFAITAGGLLLFRLLHEFDP